MSEGCYSWNPKKDGFVCILDLENSNLDKFIEFIGKDNLEENTKILDFKNAKSIKHLPNPMKGSFKCVYTYVEDDGKCYIIANEEIEHGIIYNKNEMTELQKDDNDDSIQELKKKLKEIKNEYDITTQLYEKIEEKYPNDINIIPKIYTGNVYISDIMVGDPEEIPKCIIRLFFGFQFISEKVDVGGINFMDENFIYNRSLKFRPLMSYNNEDFKKLLNFYSLHMYINSKEPTKFEDIDVDIKYRIYYCLHLKPENDGFSSIIYNHMESNRSVFIPLFKALKKIHDCGIIHRDIKDDNFAIDIGKGIVKIIDFGLAIKKEDFQKELNNTTTNLQNSKFAKDFPELFKMIQDSVTTLPTGYENCPMMMELYRVQDGYWVYSLFRTNLLFSELGDDLLFDMNTIIIWYNMHYSGSDNGVDESLKKKIEEGFPIIADIRECVFKTICKYYDEVNKES